VSASTVAFVGALFYRFKELRPLFQEHLDNQDGEVLPHLLMADVARWAEAEIVKDDDAARASVREVLAFLEDAFATQGSEVTELIAVSFLEHLPRPGEPASQLRTLVGPRLAEELRRIG
jgi:hypothetical protein